MEVDPPIKCPHCGADMVIVATGKAPMIYVAVCRVVTVEHPRYIYTPTIEIK